MIATSAKQPLTLGAHYAADGEQWLDPNLEHSGVEFELTRDGGINICVSDSTVSMAHNINPDQVRQLLSWLAANGHSVDVVIPLRASDAARDAHSRVMKAFDPSVPPAERWNRAADAAVAAALGHSVATANPMNSGEGHTS